MSLGTNIPLKQIVGALDHDWDHYKTDWLYVKQQ